MNGVAAARYRAWPDGVVIIQDGFILYHSGDEPSHVIISDVEEWLQRRFGHVDSSGPGVLERDLVRKLTRPR